MARGGKPKVRRGGGRNFSRHLELNEEGTAVATDPKFASLSSGRFWTMTDLIVCLPLIISEILTSVIYCYCRKTKRDAEEEEDDEDEEEEEEESEEEESEEEDGPLAAAPQQQELSRADRKALKKQGKKKEVAEGEDEDDDPLLVNPNRTVGRMKISDLDVSREPTRKEREAKEKADEKERYMKLHAQGKTEQAQKDLARLTKIRAEREAAQARRKAEADAKAVEIEAKKASGRR